jgi:hypothetical protein
MMVVAVNPAAGVAQTRPVFATLQSAANAITALLHTRQVHFGGTSVFCLMRLLFQVRRKAPEGGPSLGLVTYLLVVGGQPAHDTVEGLRSEMLGRGSREHQRNVRVLDRVF